MTASTSTKWFAGKTTTAEQYARRANANDGEGQTSVLLIRLDNSGTGDTSGKPNAGFFYDDGLDGDFRGRSENYFTNALGNRAGEHQRHGHTVVRVARLLEVRGVGAV